MFGPIHIRAKKEDIAPRALIAGDPGRIKQLSTLLEEPRLVNENRGLLVYTGKWKGVDVTLATHGIGVPSAAVVFEELAMLGVKAAVRLGTCGAMVKGMKLGDIVIATGAAYHPGGAYYQYLRENVCTATSPDYELLTNLVKTVSARGMNFRLGPVLSSDAFYAEDPEFAKKWASRGVIAVEMECAGLFMLGLMRGVKTAALLVVSDSLVEDLGYAHAEQLRDVVNESAKAVLDALVNTEV